jgi:hypothetical protein
LTMKLLHKLGKFNFKFPLCHFQFALLYGSAIFVNHFDCLYCLTLSRSSKDHKSTTTNARLGPASLTDRSRPMRALQQYWCIESLNPPEWGYLIECLRSTMIALSHRRHWSNQMIQVSTYKIQCALRIIWV